MLDYIGSWITGVTAAAIAAALFLALTPDGTVKKAMRLACGLLIITAVLRPVKELDLTDLAFYKTQYEEDLSAYEEKMNGVSESFTRSIIEEKTASYILEKADELEMDCAVRVKLKTDAGGGYPYPYSVEITAKGETDPSKRNALSRLIESQCAIPKERQKWVSGR